MLYQLRHEPVMEDTTFLVKPILILMLLISLKGHIRPWLCFRTRYVHSEFFFPLTSISIDVRTFLIFQVYMKSWPSMTFLTFMYLCSTFFCTYEIYKLKQKYTFCQRLNSSSTERLILKLVVWKGCGFGSHLRRGYAQNSKTFFINWGLRIALSPEQRLACL